jgi:ribosomal protein S3
MDKIRIKEKYILKMGSKHPMSLRLKKLSNWSITSYHFCSKNGLHEFNGLDKIALNVIKHYFQFALISKPKFNKDSNKIIISFYYFLNLPMSKRSNLYGQSKKIQSSLQENLTILKAEKFSSLILKLSNLYGKPVELRPVRIHYPYLNSFILAQYIALNIKRGKFNMITRNLFKKAKLVKSSTNNVMVSIKYLIKYSSTRFNPQYLSGIKIVISGRLSQRKAASRTRIVRKSMGTLSLNSSNSLIDANKFTFKGKNGSSTVKVWLSSSIANSNTSSFLFNNSKI